MPSTTVAVGPLTVPVIAGAVQSKLDDPVITALLDFIAWSFNNDLNAKLATLTGTSAFAVPNGTNVTNVDNRFDYDPLAPRGPHERRRVPSLYMWWDGQSEAYRPNQCQRGLQRNIHLLYIFDEYPSSAELVRRAGLFHAVDASLVRASRVGGHASYSYNSKAVGTALEDSIGDWLSWDWEYLGGRGLPRVGIDDPNTLPAGRHVAGRLYPAFAGLIRSRELLMPGEADAHLHDSPVTIYHDSVEVLDGTFEPDDGDNAQP